MAAPIKVDGTPLATKGPATLDRPNITINSITVGATNSTINITVNSVDPDATGIVLVANAKGGGRSPAQRLVTPAVVGPTTVTIPTNKLHGFSVLRVRAIAINTTAHSKPYRTEYVFSDLNRAPGTDSPIVATISPTEEVAIGETLTVTVTGDLGAPAGVQTQQWKRDGVDVPGATATTFTPVEGQEGIITCVVTITNVVDDAQDTSNAVTVSLAQIAPFFRNPVVISGFGAVGEVLTVSDNGNPGGYPEPEITIQWRRDGGDIPDATDVDYLVVAADAGHTIDASVMAANVVNFEILDSSNQIAIPAVAGAPVNTEVPRIGGNPTIGGAIVIESTGVWTGEPTPTLTQNWQVDEVDIPGETGNSYTVRSTDDGKSIRLHVTGSNASGSVSAYSNPIVITQAYLVGTQRRNEIAGVSGISNAAYDGGGAQIGDRILCWSFIHNSTVIPELPAGHSEPEDGPTSSGFTSAGRFSWIDILTSADLTRVWDVVGATRVMTALVRKANLSIPPLWSGWVATNDSTPDWPPMLGADPGLTFGFRGMRGNVALNTYPGMQRINSVSGQNSSLQAGVLAAGAPIEASTGTRAGPYTTVPMDELPAYEEPDLGVTSSGAHTCLVRILSAPSEIEDYAPINTSLPEISATSMTVGSVFSVVDYGKWLGIPTPEIEADWQIDGVDRRLKWAPPTLTSPVVHALPTGFWQNNGTNGPAAPADGTHTRLTPNASTRTRNMIFLGGARVEMIGGKHDIGTTSGSAVLTFASVSETIFIEGQHIIADPTMDGFKVGGWPIRTGGAATEWPVVYLQNCLVEGISGTEAGTHADGIQGDYPFDELNLDMLTIISDYQWIFVPSTFAGLDILTHIHMQRIDCKWAPEVDDRDTLHPFYLALNSAELSGIDYQIILGRAEDGNGVWLDDTGVANPLTLVSPMSDAELATDDAGREYIWWPNHTTKVVDEYGNPGRVYVGLRPGGSYVTSSKVGLGYTTPGYQSQAISNYTAVIDDVGKEIGLRVKATNREGSVLAYSRTIEITSEPLPVNQVEPSFTGSPVSGALQTGSAGTWTGSPTFAFQWLRNGNNIPGATSINYTTQAADVGNQIALKVIATNAAGSAEAISDSVLIGATGTSPVNTVRPTIALNKIKVWISADGARDPDDNVAILCGAAWGLRTISGDAGYALSGVVFADTLNGARYRMLHPTGPLPSGIPNNSLFDNTAGNMRGRGNLSFFRKWCMPAFASLQIPSYDCASAANFDDGDRLWNYNATTLGQITDASQALVADIIEAMGTSTGKVVYSAGGGANVAGEAIGYLMNNGYTKADIIPHFAVIQHGSNNWVRQYEPTARTRTVETTIALVNQDEESYPNGWDGPGLQNTINNPNNIDAHLFGDPFEDALFVAIGRMAYGSGLPSDATFVSLTDGSDVGSHAFSFDRNALLDSWDDDRMITGDNLAEGTDHVIDAASGPDRLRVLYNSVTHEDITVLFNGSGSAAMVALLTARLADDPDPASSLKIGQVLSRTSQGTWTGTPTPTLAQNWQRGGVDIAGATGNNYTIVAADAGQNIRLCVTGTNSGGSASAFSLQYTVAGTPPSQDLPPVNNSAPTFSGTATQGQTLTKTSNGGWSGATPMTFATRWQRNGARISGATADTYTTQAADVGQQIRMEIIATNTFGSVSAYSVARTIQADTPPSGDWAEVTVGPTNWLNRVAQTRTRKTRYLFEPGIYPDAYWPTNITDYDIEIVPADRFNPPTIRAISFGRNSDNGKNRNFRHLSSAPAGSNFTRKVTFDGVTFFAQRFTSATIGGTTVNYVNSMGDGSGIGFRTIGTSHPSGGFSGAREAAGYLGLNINSMAELEVVNCLFNGYSIQIDLGNGVGRATIHWCDLVDACEDIVKFRGNNVTVADNHMTGRPPSAQITAFTGGPGTRPHGDSVQAMSGGWDNLQILRNDISDPSGHLAMGQIKAGNGSSENNTRLRLQDNWIETSAQTAAWINNFRRSGTGIDGTNWDVIISGNKILQAPGVDWLSEGNPCIFGNTGGDYTDARILFDNNVGPRLWMDHPGVNFTSSNRNGVNNSTTLPNGWKHIARSKVPAGQPFSGRYGATAGIIPTN